MTDYMLKAGATSKSIEVFIFDPVTGLPDTTIIHSTAGLALQYCRKGEASVAITEVSLAALTTAWTDSGFLHIGNGNYRLDLPNAAIAAGVYSVLVHGTMTDRAIIPCHIRLVAYDPDDTVRLGLTAIPAATPGSAGGLSLYDNLYELGERGTINDTTPTTTEIILSAGFSTTDNTYIDSFIIVSSGSRRLVSVVSAYVGASRTATLSPALKATPVDGDGVLILGLNV